MGEWGSPAEAMEAALELEKPVNQSLLDLHKCADSKGDAHLCDFLEAEYLGEQGEGIKNIGDWIVKIKRAGDGTLVKIDIRNVVIISSVSTSIDRNHSFIMR